MKDPFGCKWWNNNCQIIASAEWPGHCFGTYQTNCLFFPCIKTQPPPRNHAHFPPRTKKSLSGGTFDGCWPKATCFGAPLESEASDSASWIVPGRNVERCQAIGDMSCALEQNSFSGKYFLPLEDPHYPSFRTVINVLLGRWDMFAFVLLQAAADSTNELVGSVVHLLKSLKPGLRVDPTAQPISYVALPVPIWCGAEDRLAHLLSKVAANQNLKSCWIGKLGMTSSDS